MSDPLVLIPARLAATRLPNKPLADIVGEPMIVHVWRRAIEAGIGPVVVATDTPEIVDIIEAQGGLAVLTRVDHASGSDRLAEALEIVDPEGRHDVVVNVQGDLPTIDPAVIGAVLPPLADPHVHIATLCAVITEAEEAENPNVVKLVGHAVGPGRLHALYFTRSRAPWGEGPLFHHIGLYAYRRKALTRFVSLPQGELERREKLEQLRALEVGMRIDAMIVDDLPLGVDTPADLDRARTLLARRRLN
ncbi:3-deoxy-manno-octulosonate cytidylyltransferase [Methylobacterium gnaphalii]|uniref:3-deoxy-manno-octulosonate cytidylyltransferase n=1 Tax=Methylobacterium gnaphalii TaxID=1010610 RepID=A0A512JGT7_9HYPH|nr:3-deoxy-manno-octulosonate cytidylyltransferase [Methylobacterium gnaphalii]GEP09169.1 3-deoxy-manno-octulosonate cytidylyltransferase [Methylobacterium gnaphalii]GJD67580.1 3-deoxy-manno-octulosonate cytidylyltransferase [Methylobacterium gnaphalii]GLS50492.1 3-deoxy-manno-octulosonate cytidylyltransferase [Methylobacterium gnaphalii]